MTLNEHKDTKTLINKAIDVGKELENRDKLEELLKEKPFNKLSDSDE